MARIYTRTGDQGETSLFDGTRVPKAHRRVDLYGGVDELNSGLGLALALLPGPADRGARDPAVPGADLDVALLEAMLLRVQADLLEVGAILAHPGRCRELLDGPDTPLPLDTGQLERDIDRLEEDLPRLRSFVLPGGTPAAAALHVARTVCRRVERQAVELAAAEPVPPAVVVHLNRLSDFCFVAARWANRAAGVEDVVWQARS